MIPYENYQLNSKQIERIARVKAQERIRKYIRENGHAPGQGLISTFGTISADELERYRQYYYSRSAAKENMGITATVEGWAAQTQKVYDEFIRLTYNVTDVYGKTRLFKQTNNIGYFEIDGVEKDYTGLETDVIQGYNGGTPFTHTWYANSFNSIGIHNVNVLLKNTGSDTAIQFEGVGSLREIVIPSCATSIGRWLTDCSGLQKITCYAITPPAIAIDTHYSSRSFKGFSNNGILYVPEQSISAYQETWLKPEGDYEETLAGRNWTIEPIRN